MSQEDHGGGASTSFEKVNIQIQDVIRDRKAERRLQAEEKRQGDLQRIRDMRSTTGIDPLQRFPKEIWAKIFDELDPEDRGNVWQIHPLFRDLLESSLIRDVLFPQVVKVIQKQFPYTLWPDNLHTHYNEQLRLVSKSSRKSYDALMESIVNESMENSQVDSSAHGTNTINLAFNDDDERKMLRRLLTAVKDGNANAHELRFFPRGISVSLSEYDMEIAEDNPAQMDQFKKDITEILQRIGKDIWHFRFFLEDLESVTFSFSQVYILFQGWITLMPNLKWMEVLIQPSSQLIDEKEGTAIIEQHPFPHLVHLKRITFHSTYQHPTTSGTFHNIYRVILEANQHIPKLDLNYGNDWDSDLPHGPAHLIQHLPLTRFAVVDEDWDYRYASTYLTKIRPLMNFQWKLQTIVLSLMCNREVPSIIPVFQLLQHFPTLQKVRLNQLEDFRVGDTHKIGYLELPNLTEFAVQLRSPKIDYKSNIHFFFSLHFLVKCKELKKLSWKLKGFNDFKLKEHLKTEENKNFGEMIDFRGGMRSVYDSSIWHVFPKLNTIFVELRKDADGALCCRHEYGREDIVGMSMSIRKFWKSHWCTRYGYLDVCVL